MADDLKIGVDYSEVNQATKAVDQLGQTAGRTARKTKRFAATGLQQVGYQVGDFAVQVQSGTNAMVALGQQGSQLLGILGPMGAVAGAALAIATAIGMASTSTKSLSFDFKGFVKDMKTAFSAAQPIIDGLMKGLRYAGARMMDVINFLITGYAKFLTALTHLPAVAKEAAGKFVLRFSLIKTNIDILGHTFSIFMNNVGKNAEVGMTNFNNTVSGTFLGTVAYIKAVWGTLGTVLSNAMKTAAANTIDVIENMLNSIVKRINDLSAAINSVLPEKFKSYGLGEIGDFNFGADKMFNTTDDNFGSLGQKASEAFWEAYSQAQNYAVTGNYDKLIQGQQKAIAMLKVQAAGYAKTLEQPNQALQDMYDAIASIEDIDLGSYFKFVAKQGDFALSKMQERALELSQALEKGFTDGFMSLVDGTKSAKDAFRDMAAYIIKELYRILVVQQIVGQFDINKKTGATTKSGILGAIFTGLGFEGGGYTGSGPRSGGLDGKGGFMAMLHPNETVVDHTKGQTGGVVVNQTFNFSANGDESVKRIIASEAPKIASMTQQKLMDSRRRGGSMKQVFS